MITEECLAALQKHAEDHSRGDGQVVRGVLLHDFKDRCSWTDRTWEDGRPINKCIRRCEQPFPLFIPKGTEVAAMVWSGYASGRPMVHLKHQDVWFEIEGADYFLELIGVDSEPWDNEEIRF